MQAFFCKMCSPDGVARKSLVVRLPSDISPLLSCSCVEHMPEHYAADDFVLWLSRRTDIAARELHQRLPFVLWLSRRKETGTTQTSVVITFVGHCVFPSWCVFTAYFTTPSGYTMTCLSGNPNFTENSIHYQPTSEPDRVVMALYAR